MRQKCWCVYGVLSLIAAVVLVGGCGRSLEFFHPQPEQVLYDGQRVLVLGDSISQNGRYVQYLDAYLQTRRPDQRIEIVNIGLSSETASGLSEPGHPQGRPHVHDRLDAALDRVQPDVVMVCYGMNDGIYRPFSEERFEAYREGMWHVIERIEDAGATPLLLTPPPFDPLPLADRVVPADAEELGYATPYEGYDDVLATYGEWLLSLREHGYHVADVGGTIRRHVAERRQIDPDYTHADDGVHPGPFGHWLMTQAVLEAIEASAVVDRAHVDVRREWRSLGVHDLEVTEEGAVGFTWVSRVPMPMDPEWPAELIEHERIEPRFNRHELIVENLPHETYELYEGDDRLATVTREQLAAGVDVRALEPLATNRHAAEVWPLVRERQEILSPAWREHVGYEFHREFEALPFAEARERGMALERDIRDLARRVTLNFRLIPAE